MIFPEDLPRVVIELQTLSPHERPSELMVYFISFAEDTVVDGNLIEQFCHLVAPQLESLTLCHMKGLAVEQVFLEKILSQSLWLKSLLLAGALLSDGLGQIVTQQLWKNSTRVRPLTHLSFRMCGWTTPFYHHLQHTWMHHQNDVQELRLILRHQGPSSQHRDNRKAAFQEFANLLQACPTLKALHIMPLLDQKYDDIVEVLAAIGRHPFLETLRVGTVRRGENLQALLQIVVDASSQSQLKHLHMDGTEVLTNPAANTTSWMPLLPFLKNLQTLEMELWYNQPEDGEHFKVFCNVLRQNTSITSGISVDTNRRSRAADLAQVQRVIVALQRQNRRILQVQQLLQGKDLQLLPTPSCWPLILEKLQDYLQEFTASQDRVGMENPLWKHPFPIDPTPMYLFLQSHVLGLITK